MVELSSNEANVVISIGDPLTLSHQRLSHMSENGIKMLVFKGKIPKLKNVEVSFCEPCA